MEVVGHCVGPVTLVQMPVAGSQHAPWPGMQGLGWHDAAEVAMPPPRVHSAASTIVQVLAAGQQQAIGWLVHPPASGHVRFGKNCPPSCEQMFALVCTQVLVPAAFGMQHAPKNWLVAPPLDGQTAGLQLVTQMPPSARQSHWLGTVTQPVGAQHCPLGRQGLGWQDTMLGNGCPTHAEILNTSAHVPEASQHTITGHGLGWHDVAVVSGTPFGNGHGTAVEHAPVCGSQHTLSGGHGLGLHVEPG